MAPGNAYMKQVNIKALCHCGECKDGRSLVCRKCYKSNRARIARNLEKAVLLFYSCGLFPQEISKRIGCSRKSIETMLTAAQRHLRIFGQANVTKWAIKTGLVQL